MSKSNYLYVIDAGHGGVKNGVYTTAPAKMHTFPDGLTICEGIINRAVARLLWLDLTAECIDFKLVYDEQEDYSLPKRVAMADKIFEKDKRAIYLAIHSNAAPIAGQGSGNEIYTSPGQTKSDKVANIFCETYQKFFPEYPFRCDKADGDWDKEAEFYVLRKTDCPALLVENFFFDNRREAEMLLSEQGQRKIADCLLACIQNVEKLKPI